MVEQGVFYLPTLRCAQSHVLGLKAQVCERSRPKVHRAKRDILEHLDREACFSGRGDIFLDRSDLRTPVAVEWLLIFGATEETVENEDMAFRPQKPLKAPEPGSARKGAGAVDGNRGVEAIFPQHCRSIATNGLHSRCYPRLSGKVLDKSDMRRRYCDRGNIGTKFLGPENGTTAETAADIQYIATQARRGVPQLRCVLEGALLCGNQVAVQLLARRTNGGWLVDQSRVVMDARP